MNHTPLNSVALPLLLFLLLWPLYSSAVSIDHQGAYFATKAPPASLLSISPRNNETDLPREHSLQRRDETSRIELGLYIRPGITSNPSKAPNTDPAAYHWCLLTVPESNPQKVNAYDVSNAIEVKQGGYVRNNNPYRHPGGSLNEPFNTAKKIIPFQHQWKIGVDPGKSNHLAARIIISDTTTLDLAQFEGIVMGVTPPDVLQKQTCVDWTKKVISRLQAHGMVRSFDLEPFTRWALRYADEGFALATSKSRRQNFLHIADYRARDTKASGGRVLLPSNKDSKYGANSGISKNLNKPYTGPGDYAEGPSSSRGRLRKPYTGRGSSLEEPSFSSSTGNLRKPYTGPGSLEERPGLPGTRRNSGKQPTGRQGRTGGRY